MADMTRSFIGHIKQLPGIQIRYVNILPI